MTTYEEILIIANQLANEGRKPSVALVKTKLSQAVPLPELIRVLKNWQHQPEYVTAKSTTVTRNKKAQIKGENEVQKLIEQAIAPLKLEIAELKAQIAQLIENKD